MTGRERLIAALGGKATDRPAWAPLIDNYYSQQFDGADDLAVIRRIGADVMLRHVQAYRVVDEGCVFRSSRTGDIERQSYETASGCIQAVIRYGGHSSCIVEPFVKTIDDLRIMKQVVLGRRAENDYDNFRQTDRRIGEDGIATCTLPCTPLQYMLNYYAGLENFVNLNDDYPDEVEEFLDILHRENLQLYKMMAQSPADIAVFFAYEGTSTTSISPRWYKKYCLGQINEYADILHNGNKKYFTHMCGKLDGLLDIIAQGRQDGIDSVCPPHSGDVEAPTALQRLPGKIIIGGLEPAALTRLTADEAAAYAVSVLQSCAAYPGRFILSTGDATAYDTPLANLQAVSVASRGINS